MNGAQTERLLGYAVYSESAEACVATIAQWVESGHHARWLACLNPHSYAVSVNIPAFSAALRRADWVIPDGIGVVLASRIRGGNIRARVTGQDVFLGLTRRLNDRGGARYFFLGASEATLARIRARMAVEFPSVEVAGTHSPPFAPEFSEGELDEMVAAVNATRADVVWVGMTAPKQELWIDRVLERLDVKFVAAIGAVFDFYSGNVIRSHPAFQRVGLEWLPRLLREPRRLWRRTFVSAPLFVWHVLRGRDLTVHDALDRRGH